jgi:rhodanese-related sulfurtransferase
MARITPEELRDRLNAGEDLFIVDLRSRITESPNLIPGAKSISPEDLAARREEIPRDRDIILFCS